MADGRIRIIGRPYLVNQEGNRPRGLKTQLIPFGSRAENVSYSGCHSEPPFLDRIQIIAQMQYTPRPAAERRTVVAALADATATVGGRAFVEDLLDDGVRKIECIDMDNSLVVFELARPHVPDEVWPRHLGPKTTSTGS